MEKSEVFNLTDLDTIVAQAKIKLEESCPADVSHSLFTRGIYAGMEILAASIAQSMRHRQRLISESETPSE